MLTITDLSVSVADQPILDRLSLHVPAGQIHALMGPNGSGKSTLAKTLAGHPAYVVTGGSVTYQGRDLLALEPESRVHAGVFVGFQYPVEVPGVANAEFLRLAYNAKAKATGGKEISAKEFAPILAERIRQSEAPADFDQRELNAGMSGGQRKRNEILQMFVLEPALAILDETDSGLDIDAIKAVARGINAFRRADRAVVLITHFQRLLEMVVPDRVHVLKGGRIVASGGPELATVLEAEGYGR
ncbi:ABC transporter ATP-binding protein [Planctomycetota bacterium]|nr:ABC transporter ATP-binding protein [Planctomycetota bacterium]